MPSPSNRYLARSNDNDLLLVVELKPIETNQHQQQQQVSTTWQLEECIEKHVKKTNDNDDDDDDDTRVLMGHRHDASLLECRRPHVSPLISILGIYEESVEEHELEENNNNINPPIQVHVYETSVMPFNDDSASSFGAKLAPHAEWKRTQLSGHYGTKSNDKATPTHIKWMDLRRHAPCLETPANSFHFLRGVLGVSHFASPWASNTTNDDDNGNHDDLTRNYPVVAIVLPNNDESLLEDFRTTDACPSYFLHSISRLEVPATATDWWSPSTTANGDFIQEKQDATLLVYRRLTPRDALSTTQPAALSTVEILPMGCLWETFMRQTNDDHDDKDNAIFEECIRPVAPPYISHRQDYPNLLEPLLQPENFEILQQEAKNIPQWTAWPEKQHYSSSNDDNAAAATWTVFPLCHCFPANQVENRKFLTMTCNHVPQTVAMLKQYLGDSLRTALYSRLDAESTLEAHTGWQDLANHVYRIHIPLVVPPGGLCGTWVDGCVETHTERQPLVFDDSKIHRAFNYSHDSEARVVLILDLARPEHLPVGTATGGHTDELDKFIDQLN